MGAIRKIEAGRICPTAPDVIWLQTDPECSEGDTPVYPGDNIGEVTWCWHDINDSDTKYVRADIHAQTLASKEAELAEAGLKYVSLFGELQGAMEEIARKTEALETIASWRLPETSEVWPSGNRVSYEGAYGSNGARDYMRKVARAALTTTPQPTE